MLKALALMLCLAAPILAQPASWTSLAAEFQAGPAPAPIDLRTMLTRHLVQKSCAALDSVAQRRQNMLAEKRFVAWKRQLRTHLLTGLGPMPYNEAGCPLNIRAVSKHTAKGYRIENVLFESLPGWEVNASLYLPLQSAFPPPWSAIIIPVGHSCKARSSYQYPAQIFARFGYAAITFDPPGMAGEKQAGNDHFRDGVRCYLTGQSSNRYFVLDALRCIDYLQTRTDITLDQGVAMTGVSGGGTTSLFAAAIDDRITVLGPSCCAVPKALHPILDQYAECAEPMPFRRFLGYDDIDLMVAAAPAAVLLMAGAEDEVFTEAMSKRMAKEVAENFALAGYPNRFSFFLDEGGHAYTPAMAQAFLNWLDQHHEHYAPRAIPLLQEADLELLDQKLLTCHPRQDGNIFSINKTEALRLRSARSGCPLSEATRTLIQLDSPAAYTLDLQPPERVWHHYLVEAVLQPEYGIALPFTLLYPAAPAWRGGAVLFFDDKGRWTELRKHGPLASLSGFLQENTKGPAICSVDLRGLGDSRPADMRYDLAGWGERDRWLTYSAAAAGDSIMAMRIRDASCALACLKNHAHIDPKKIVVGGRGVGGMVALHLAALHPELAGVFSYEALAAYELLATSESYAWPMQAILPEVLLHYDLPELAAALETPVLIAAPRDANRAPLGTEDLHRYYPEKEPEPKIRILPKASFQEIAHFVQEVIK